MKLNIKKFMMTEMGGELEETIKAWDQALEERRKATPGIGDPNQEEMEKQKDLIKQLAEAGQEVAAGIEDLLKEMFNGE